MAWAAGTGQRPDRISSLEDKWFKDYGEKKSFFKDKNHSKIEWVKMGLEKQCQLENKTWAAHRFKHPSSASLGPGRGDRRPRGATHVLSINTCKGPAEEIK